MKPFLIAASLAVFVFATACSGGDKGSDATTAPSDGTTGTSSLSESGSPVLQSSQGTAGALGTVLATVASSATSAASSPVSPSSTTGTANTPGPGNTVPVATARPTTAPGSTPVGSVGTAAVTAVIASRSGNSIELVLSASAEGAQKLGGWAVDVEYDPARITVDTCTVGEDGVCNPKFNDRTVRVVGIALNGKSGEIGRIKLNLNGSGATNIQVKPGQCVTPEGMPLTCNPVTFAIPAQ